MRKIATILLLFITTFGVVGYNFIFSALKEFHREEMMEKIANSKIPDNLLTRIDANSDGLTWVEKGKEFYYQNMLFDVLRTETKDGSAVLVCVSDKAEEIIINGQNQKIQDDAGNSPAKNGKTSSGSQQIDLYCQLLSATMQDVTFTTITNRTLAYTSPLSCIVQDITTPPPQLG